MRIYLAGPEVFLADAAGLAAAKRAICAEHGLQGVFPGDDGAGTDWRRLYAALEAQLSGCAALIANCTPFRGPSADPGTAFEMGFMRALGRPVLAYANTTRGFGARSLAAIGPAARRRADGSWEDGEGMAVEEFDLPENLMLPGAVDAAGGCWEVQAVPAADRWRDLAAFRRCVARAAALLRG